MSLTTGFRWMHVRLIGCQRRGGQVGRRCRRGRSQIRSTVILYCYLSASAKWTQERPTSPPSKLHLPIPALLAKGALVLLTELSAYEVLRLSFDMDPAGLVIPPIVAATAYPPSLGARLLIKSLE